MSTRRFAATLVATGVFLLLAGLMDDLIRTAIWELFAAAGLLFWYGPAKKFRRHHTKE